MRVTSMDTYSAQALANLYKTKSSEETESTDFLTSEYESKVEKLQQEIENRTVSEVSADMSSNSNGMKHRMSLASEEVMDVFKTSADAITESDAATVTSQDQSDALEALQEAAANAGISLSGLSETDITSLSEEEVSDLYESVSTELSDMKAKGPGGPGGPPPMGPPPTESDDEDDDELSTIEAILEAFEESSDDITSSDDDLTTETMTSLLSDLQASLVGENAPFTNLQNVDLNDLNDDEVESLYNDVKSELSDMKAKGPGGPPPMGPPPTEETEDDETSDEEELLTSLQQWLEKRAQTQYQNTSLGYGISNTLFDEMY